MNRAIFLDRDGVINVEKKYVYRIEDFEFIDGIFPLLRSAQQYGYLPVVITNQAGIGRGYYGEEEFQRLTAWMLECFEEEGVHIAGVYHCPYHPQAGIGSYRQDSLDRKPNPGMLFNAKQELDIDLAASILIGDKLSDIEAGRAAGVETLVLLGRKSVEDDDVISSSSLVEIRSILFE